MSSLSLFLVCRHQSEQRVLHEHRRQTAVHVRLINKTGKVSAFAGEKIAPRRFCVLALLNIKRVWGKSKARTQTGVGDLNKTPRMTIAFD